VKTSDSIHFAKLEVLRDSVVVSDNSDGDCEEVIELASVIALEEEMMW
jgi:hypothetical protein